MLIIYACGASVFFIQKGRSFFINARDKKLTHKSMSARGRVLRRVQIDSARALIFRRNFLLEIYSQYTIRADEISTVRVQLPVFHVRVKISFCGIENGESFIWISPENERISVDVPCLFVIFLSKMEYCGFLYSTLILWRIAQSAAAFCADLQASGIAEVLKITVGRAFFPRAISENILSGIEPDIFLFSKNICPELSNSKRFFS